MSTTPRPSAGVCLLRRGPGGTEVLMVQRGGNARFMGGAWVFPGGTIDRVDHGDQAAAALREVPDTERPWRAAAVRELVEEAGVWMSRPPLTLSPTARPRGIEVFRRANHQGPPLAAEQMLLFSNWVTPTLVPVRFDARFYVAEAPDDLGGEPDGEEVVAAEWVTPQAAVAGADADTFLLPFPTRKTLLHFASLGDVDAIMSHARSSKAVSPIHPRLRIVEEVLEAVLPGEPGYDDLPDAPPDREVLGRVTTVRSATGERIPELER